MTKLSDAVLGGSAIGSALGVGLLGLHLAFGAVAAGATSADLILCDRLAADPADPDKPADVRGVAEIVPSDVKTAITYCRSASSASRRALYQLGRAYAASGQSPEAMAAYRKAADKGSTSAMVELGVMLGTGTGIAKDQVAARTLFERAAEAGNARGVTNLVALSDNGGPPLDPVRERDLLTRAADTNSAEAQFQLGLMYADGVGGPKDDAAARALFAKAAAQNHAAALEWMGAFAQTGRGGPKDSSAAKSYYERSAALGDANAKTALKRMECPLVFSDKRGEVLYNLCY